MQHFFAPSENAESGRITITGPDVNHITNVLRLKTGDRIVVADGQDRDSLCEIEEAGPGFVRCKVLPQELAETECPVRLHLFPGLPKGMQVHQIEPGPGKARSRPGKAQPAHVVDPYA